MIFEIIFASKYQEKQHKKFYVLVFHFYCTEIDQKMTIGSAAASQVAVSQVF